MTVSRYQPKHRRDPAKEARDRFRKLARKTANATVAGSLAISTLPYDQYVLPATTNTACSSPEWSELGNVVAKAAQRAPGGTIPRSQVITQGVAPAVPSERNPAIYIESGDLIAQAKKEVLIETYIWTSSPDTEQILDGLEQLQVNRKAEAEATGAPVKPVKVYILVDRTTQVPYKLWSLVNGTGFQNPKGDPLDDVNADLASIDLDPKFVDVQLVPYDHLFTGANHAKAVVVDNTVGQVTGSNPQSASWYDLGFTFEGDIVQRIRNDVADSLHRAAGIRLEALPQRGPALCDQVPMALVSRAAVGGLPPNFDNPQTAAQVSMLAHAKKKVKILYPNLNAAPVVEAVLDAVRRGVEVELLLTIDFNEKKEEIPFQGGGNRASVKKMFETLEKEGKAKRFHVRWYSNDGELPATFKWESEGGPGAHGKFMSADEQVALVGSGIPDTQGSGHSHELNVLVDDAATVKAWDAETFNAEWERAIVVHGSSDPTFAPGFVDSLFQ